LSCAASAADAPPPNPAPPPPAKPWHLLASTSVTVTPPDAAPQHHEMRLPSARGSFAHIRLAVAGAAVTLDRLVVTFAHGSTQSVDVHKTIKSGGVTADIALQGSDHVIRQVDFWYATKQFAQVRLYGQ
jgi:hypothetical protein